jgi:hypothetical protein
LRAPSSKHRNIEARAQPIVIFLGNPIRLERIYFGACAVNPEGAETLRP